MLSVSLAASVLVLVPIRPAPPIPLVPIANTPFDIMMKEIQSARISGDWKQARWQPKTLQRELANIVEQVQKTTEDDSVALPIRFEDVKPKGEMPGIGMNELVVGADLDLRSTFKSIILSDGSVKIGFAENCVIIARGGVYIAHGCGNVIIAGQAVHVSHDGNHGRAGAGKGSLILANVWLDVSHSNNGGIFAAPDLDISFANATTIVNPQGIAISHKKQYAEHTERNFRVFSSPSNRLEKSLTITSIEYKDDWTKSRATFTDANGGQLVVGIGNDFTGNGRARPELAGWRVTMISQHFVIVSDGAQDVGFPKSRSR
jgi:hypothetical protein